MGVGMPNTLMLQRFGELVYRAFGWMPYHVGSSLRDKTGWRDVDVRVLVPDEDWARLELGTPGREVENARWCAITLAWATFGRHLTGLPIDFQLQQQSYANATFGTREHRRSALFDVADMYRMDAAINRAVAREAETPEPPPVESGASETNE